jgi:hypothetical protein
VQLQVLQRLFDPVGAITCSLWQNIHIWAARGISATHFGQNFVGAAVLKCALLLSLLGVEELALSL